MLSLSPLLMPLSSISRVEPTTEEILEMYREVNKFSLVSHFYWAIWALVQTSVSDIDFDYMGYAVLRFSEYYRRKEEMLAL